MIKVTRQQFLQDADGFYYFLFEFLCSIRTFLQVHLQAHTDRLAVYLQSGSFFQFVGIPIL